MKKITDNCDCGANKHRIDSVQAELIDSPPIFFLLFG